MPLEESRSLKTFFVLTTLLSQIAPNGYGTAVGTSDELNFSRGSSRVLTANWILRIRANDIFLGLPLDFLLSTTLRIF